MQRSIAFVLYENLLFVWLISEITDETKQVECHSHFMIYSQTLEDV
ncbi:hypothetical protein VB735_09255 [Halotia wernerae UHCC 0503]|nr:hypothetical protein [Halotia wernerae UHCC 0503]